MHIKNLWTFQTLQTTVHNCTYKQRFTSQIRSPCILIPWLTLVTLNVCQTREPALLLLLIERLCLVMLAPAKEHSPGLSEWPSCVCQSVYPSTIWTCKACLLTRFLSTSTHCTLCNQQPDQTRACQPARATTTASTEREIFSTPPEEDPTTGQMGT